MAKFKPGQSGNPKGRPPKERALTALLEAAGNVMEETPDGKRRARKRILAELGWGALMQGRITLPSGRTLEISGKDWLDFYRWVYTHIDGNARSGVAVSVDGVKLVIKDETAEDETGEAWATK